MNAIDAPSDSIVIRTASVDDGKRIYALVEASGVLEPNTCYAYLLLATHFGQTCMVAERDGALVGFVAAYRPPTHPETVFVWQIGVDSAARGAGLGKRLLHALVDGPGCDDVTHLEATVAPSNVASTRLFEGFARERGAACTSTPCFEPHHFGPAEHEEEPVLRIGPFPTRA